jgi:hypothetical protein
MKDMEPTSIPATWTLEGTYSEQDLRTFASFLANRVAGVKLWTLGLIMLLPVYWYGDIRKSWHVMVPVALVIIGFVVLFRFVILPNKLYRAAIKLPGVFEPRTVTIDAEQVSNQSASGGHTFRLDDIKEVIAAPEHLFVMVTPKQGIPIPRTWVGDEARVSQLTRKLLSKRINAA